jgi:signal transduction histidine kinase/ActR/RegA family two-component response regulator
MRSARRTGRTLEEGWRLRKNGERFWARVVVTPLYDSGGLLRGFAKVTQDLSERRQIQHLEQAAKNVHQFIAMLAHELRNPLAAVRYGVRVMSQAPLGDPAHGTMLQTIDRQSAQLTRIVDDMLDISRITRGGISIERKHVDMAEVVRGAIETAAPLTEAAQHKVDVDAPEGQVFVQGDVQRLTQLVANLLANSARYTPEGGSITVKARAEDGFAILRVRDTGMGIEPHMIERIFDLFARGPQPPQQVGIGLGVGLAVARRIAELHGGLLEAHSEGQNKGSEFTLRLPLSDVPEAWATSAGAAAEPEAMLLMPRRVLVVDDNVDGATALTLLLESLGHETCVVHDGIQALRVAGDFRPDVVLLDIAMPGIDGYEVARQLRAIKKDTPLRIIAVTGYGQESDRQKSREAGFDVHLVKPVEVNDLAQALGERNAATLH